MSDMKHDLIRQNVRNRYKQIALEKNNNCCSPHTNCSDGTPTDVDAITQKLGYSEEDLSTLPAGANMGLGCGNPQTIAELKPGEVVLDLGSGGGMDCFLASKKVGVNGRVIGVDMTPEMVSKARTNASKGGFINTEFRLGEIEHLPVENETIDVIISNCVINLSPNKPQVFNEAYRVLKSGGRLAISDIVTTTELPPKIKNDGDTLYSGCISGASSIGELYMMLEQTDFTQVTIEVKDESKAFIKNWVPGAKIEDYIVSAVIKGVKN